MINDIELLRAARPGRDLRTSIDLRLQYLAYRELKAAVADSGARSGSVVVLDPRTGEMLAMANQPSYNPNAEHEYAPDNIRNRAITDIFEPGSTSSRRPGCGARVRQRTTRAHHRTARRHDDQRPLITQDPRADRGCSVDLGDVLAGDEPGWHRKASRWRSSEKRTVFDTVKHARRFHRFDQLRLAR